jgi:hypothetical protein
MPKIDEKKKPRKFETVIGIVKTQNKPTRSRRLPLPDYSAEMVFWDGTEWKMARGIDLCEVVDWFPIPAGVYSRIIHFTVGGE